MEQERHYQLRETIALHIIPVLREVRHRQIAIQATIWAGLALTAVGLVVLVGMVGVLLYAD